MLHWRLGTMGFGYDEWSGVFYPEHMKSSEYLAFYARHFDTVELDTTFHATPPAERVRGWADVTPPDFRFCVKMPKLVTHALRLEGAIGPAVEFVNVMRQLGEKLAVVLIQFPPSFRGEHLRQLDVFLGQLPRDVRFAVEFRDRSWGSHETVEMLRSHRVCFATAEYLTRRREIPVTADFLYVRWIGQHRRFPTMDRVRIDVSEYLRWWRDQLTGRANGLGCIYGFFNNDYAGFAPATCNQFKEMLGLPVAPTESPQHGTLF